MAKSWAYEKRTDFSNVWLGKALNFYQRKRCANKELQPAHRIDFVGAQSHFFARAISHRPRPAQSVQNEVNHANQSCPRIQKPC